MRINNNIPSMVVRTSLFHTERQSSKTLNRMSTGLRLNKAGDDAAGLAISERLRAQVKGSQQARRNAQNGISALNIAEGAANEVSSILQRMRELAIGSSNDTLTDTERQFTNQEFKQLSAEIDRISDVTNFNGMKLISSSSASGESRFGEGTTGSSLWVGANGKKGNDSFSITIASLATQTTGLGISDDSVASQSSSRNAISALDLAINSVNTMRSSIGSTVRRLEHTIANLDTKAINTQDAESQIRDADFALESSNFAREQILQQSASSMLAQANHLHDNVLSIV